MSATASTAGGGGDDAYLYGKRQTVLVFFATMLGMSLAPFTLGVVATSLPHIARDLGGFQLLPWVMTAYLLTASVTVPLWGKLADVYGRRPAYVSALALFAGGALLAGLAPTMPLLIAGRVITGIGAGGMVPVSMAITSDLMAPRERGKWVGVSGVLFGGFSVIAPAFGGWVTDTAGWRWCFFTVAALGALALTVAWTYVTIERPKHHRDIDYVGAALIMAGVGSLLVAISLGGEQYAWGSPQILGLLGFAVLLLATFAWWYRRAADPILPLSLFRIRTFTVAQIGIIGFHGTLLSTMTFAPLLIQGILSLSAGDAGALLVPYSLAMMIVGFLSGQVVSRTGHYRGLLIAAPLVIAAGAYELTLLQQTSPTTDAMVALLLIGAGLGLVSGTIVVVVQNAVPSEEQGAASTFTAFTRIMAGAVVVAVVGAVMTARVGSEIQQRLPARDASSSSLGALAGGGAGGDEQEAQQVRAAFAAGAPAAFRVVLPLLGLTLVAMLLVEPRELRRTLVETVPAVERIEERVLG